MVSALPPSCRDASVRVRSMRHVQLVLFLVTYANGPAVTLPLAQHHQHAGAYQVCHLRTRTPLRVLSANRRRLPQSSEALGRVLPGAEHPTWCCCVYKHALVVSTTKTSHRERNKISLLVHSGFATNVKGFGVLQGYLRGLALLCACELLALALFGPFWAAPSLSWRQHLLQWRGSHMTTGPGAPAMAPLTLLPP